MSDPVTNVEIEDILSSIRRLVSDEDRSDEESENSEDNRLVLTPSLRVHAGETAESEESTSDEEPPTEEAYESGATNSEDEAAETETHDIGTASAGEADDLEPDGLRARIAALEDSVATREDQWDPDGPSDDDYAGGPVETLPWEDHFEERDEPDEPVEAEALQTSQYAGEHPEEDEVTPTFSEGQAESRSHPYRVHSEQESLGGDDAGTEQEAASGEMAELLGGDDAILDEDALREVIAEIVRQELQGSLGERITRNVRKLVRREIHRALASHDLN